MSINKLSLSEQIYQDMRERIANRDLLPGQRLVVRQLQELYDVSSTPIRDALFLLQSNGFITVSSGGSARIVEMDEEKIRHFKAALRVSYIATMRLIVENGQQEKILALLREQYQKELDCLNAPDRVRSKAHADFINIFTENTGNPIWFEMTGPLLGKSVVAFGGFCTPEALEDDRRLIAAMEAEDYDEVLDLLIKQVDYLE